MKNYFLLLITLMLLVSCSNQKNKKQPESINVDSIHKVWEFKNIDTGNASGNLAKVSIPKNYLDLTNKDTLKLSYHNTKNPPTKYPYTIKNDTIFVKNGMVYKILSLSGNELRLSNSYLYRL